MADGEGAGTQPAGDPDPDPAPATAPGTPAEPLEAGGQQPSLPAGGSGAPGEGDEPSPYQPFITQAAVEDPVEILVAMAERGEIDPWNINIIEVTDRFLAELEHRRELNLQISGRTLFFAATLLRMKSEQLVKIEPPEDDGEGAGEEDLFGEGFGAGMEEEIDFGSRLGPIERLEHEIQRRLDRKSMRKSPVTLFELIVELKNLEKAERRRRRMESDIPDSLLYDADDVVSIAHEEGFQESSMVRLAEYLEGLDLEEEMTLRELCERMEWGVPEVYIPLLFLALDGRCNLRQEEFFGDIWVRICRAEAAELVQDSPGPS